MEQKHRIRSAILRHLKNGRRSKSISDVAAAIRRKNKAFRNTPDFDFRANVLSLIASGTLQSTTDLRLRSKKK